MPSCGDRANFRIQGKCLTASKRASYLSNTSWGVSPRPMKIKSIIDNWFKQVFQLHTHLPLWYIALFTISHFLLQILRISDNDGKGKFRDFSLLRFFKKLTEMPPSNCKIQGKKFKEICKSLATMVWQRRNACFVIFRINHF